ncbi:related to positive regulator of PUT (proline utilization) genes [Ramularia collo-cygni]|uniref:Related to positive regulator of PUT (Proline utilization) genes n=1 Tax=Ramularia collo-cygni TaxID=112498 RepID=A0A2D3UV05_9PEZI|nr:related to positive regulator of PUT (proline utilization) genes [Ramularia collo-cygni]CZT21502.1 related to positive regulator of PUT (proline utilization) genes [Ramularia collo-cygni]
MSTPGDNGGTIPKRRRIERVTAACDLCKARKVKCDGQTPCSYCVRKKRADNCVFSGPRPRTVQSACNTPGNAVRVDPTQLPALQRRRSEEHSHRPRELQDHGLGRSISPNVSRDDHQEGTAVPLEARLLRDAQGKVIFIGDCAPLSFLQTVRHLIASEVDPDGFPVASSRDSIVEVPRPELSDRQSSAFGAPTAPLELAGLIEEYSIATTGLVDLFEKGELQSWITNAPSTAPYFLVLAIGKQGKDEVKAESWFKRARDDLLINLCGSMNVATVQGFALVSLYMLRAFQPNGAYLYFSLAARTAYAIGLHRTEVNASFGSAKHAMRDRIWKSLRVVDMLISNLLGRPPSTSDVDCTVKYNASETSLPFLVLDSSVQIFMIIERVVVEVYSRKRISLRIATYVSHQLKSWASRWMRQFVNITSRTTTSVTGRDSTVGACQVLCSYYYGIMLLTKPFLLYELYDVLGAPVKAPTTQAENDEKKKFADAALDAASSFVETLQAVIATGSMPLRMPLIVSWLFTTSLVLAIGNLGQSGLVFEESCQASIRCLDYFAKVDPHARQYSLIVQSLLKTVVKHVRERELLVRSRRKQASSQLFGLLPIDDGETEVQPPQAERTDHDTPPLMPDQEITSVAAAPADLTMYDADFFAMPWLNETDEGLQDFLQPGRQTLDGSLADIPLFPMYDQMTGSFGPDLANGL